MSALGIIRPGRRLRILRRPPESILPSTPRPARRDCHGRLLSALVALAGRDAAIADSGLRPWHSATFIGSRHDIVLAIGGEGAATRAADLCNALPCTEFRLPGHIVADVKAEIVETNSGEEARLRLEILTIEAW